MRARVVAGEGDDARDGAEHREIEQDVGKLLFGDKRAIERQHEHLFAKARDVLQDAAEISWFHFFDFDIGRCANK